ncbi:NAD(P)H-binding protein [Niveispirillum sp. SYP-B3756]|uniref:SDR family oxidoreductase n=1 Tax=Niveispirillum sp. SYP-B3756 TaxID=2662178 RepID=UPI0012929D71|nr:SDR family oxidoreductase [Niveispirillum sp. SYP-B3756]MQP64997.1 NAD(P)H-binding protein [Niveispirillum sp. SYP-B3756]
MRILIIGAGGFVGRHLLARLMEGEDTVIVAGRNPARLQRRFPETATMSCDLAHDRAADWQARLHGIDAVINLAGVIRDGAGRFAAVHDQGAKALFNACLAAGVRQVIQLSALGADETGISPYHRSKKAADDHLASLDPTGQHMNWAILRPSLIIGRGGASTEMLLALAAAPLPLRLGPGTWQVQPIHVDDVVEVIIHLLHRAGPFTRRLDLAGPVAMTTDGVTRALRNWLGLRPAPFLPLPPTLLMLGAVLGDRFGLGPASRDSLIMLKAGNVGDDRPVRELLGRPARALPVALARHPAMAADRWRARLLPLALPLRLLLAALWIWTGIVSLGLYPVSDSDALLAPLGLTGLSAGVALYTGALLDLTLGLALLCRWRPVAVGAAQLVLMVGYTVLISLYLPDLWLHPFGAITKNLVVAGATLVMMAMEAENG